MKKTKKRLTIEAHQQIAKKYRTATDEECLFNHHSCPLCRIHGVPSIIHANNCRGCPLANKEGAMGCDEFLSYQEAINYFNRSLYLIIPNNSFDKRAKFHEKLIPILEQIPAKRFTKKGWKYFEEVEQVEKRM